MMLHAYLLPFDNNYASYPSLSSSSLQAKTNQYE
jgi:hypothetical protein